MITDRTNNKSIVGVYLLDGCVDGIRLGVTRQPTRFQRFCARIFLGWKWATLKELKDKEENGN
jgi:hypothetical protein